MSKTVVLPPETDTILKGYKVPLTEIVGGFGYYGTIAYDKKTKKFTQCFICGNFYAGLGAHVKRTHELAVKDYKMRYGLSVRTSLASPVMKKIYRDSQPNEHRVENLEIGREQLSHDDRMRASTTRISLIERNKRGTCPDQTLEKIYMLREKLHRLPTRREFINEYGHGPIKTIRLLFGSWSEALRQFSE